MLGAHVASGTSPGVGAFAGAIGVCSSSDIISVATAVALDRAFGAAQWVHVISLGTTATVLLFVVGRAEVAGRALPFVQAGADTLSRLRTRDGARVVVAVLDEAARVIGTVGVRADVTLSARSAILATIISRWAGLALATSPRIAAGAYARIVDILNARGMAVTITS